MDFDEFRPTVASLVPEMAAFLAVRKLFNPELSLVLIGAGDCSDTVLSAVRSSGIRVCFGYGLTETSSGIALSIGEDPRAMTVCPDYKVEIEPDGEIACGLDADVRDPEREQEGGQRALLAFLDRFQKVRSLLFTEAFQPDELLAGQRVQVRDRADPEVELQLLEGFVRQ